jgi:metacaspase-1
MSYPGQHYHVNHQDYYAPPQQPPPNQGQFYGPPPGAPPPNMASRPNYNYHAPNGPPVDYNHNAYAQGQYRAPPPPPQHAQMFNQQVGNQYTFQYSACTGKRKVLSGDDAFIQCVGIVNRNQLLWHPK